MQITVTGIEEVKRNLAINIPKQVRFATMQAMNDCALAVQRFEVETQLPSKLTLRAKGSPWWRPGTRFGINIRFATRETLRSAVGSMADWLKLQEEGGTRTGNGHRLAVEAGARANPKSILTPAIKPRQLLRRVGDVSLTRTGRQRVARKAGGGFILQTARGPAIYTRNSGGLKLMYGLERSAKVPAILNFFQSGKRIVEVSYQRIFAARFNKAMQTAKS